MYYRDKRIERQMCWLVAIFRCLFPLNYVAQIYGILLSQFRKIKKSIPQVSYQGFWTMIIIKPLNEILILCKVWSTLKYNSISSIISSRVLIIMLVLKTLASNLRYDPVQHHIYIRLALYPSISLVCTLNIYIFISLKD